jgi:YD repeat-containing protein
LSFAAGEYVLTLATLNTRVTFNAEGLPLSESILNFPIGAGHRLTFGYSGTNLTNITDSVGRVIRLSYNPDGTVSTLELPDGRITRYSYSGGLLITVEHPDGATTHYGYLHGLLTDFAGLVSNAYDENDRVSSQTDALGGTTTYTYQTSGAEDRTLVEVAPFSLTPSG